MKQINDAVALNQSTGCKAITGKTKPILLNSSGHIIIHNFVTVDHVAFQIRRDGPLLCRLVQFLKWQQTRKNCAPHDDAEDPSVVSSQGGNVRGTDPSFYFLVRLFL